MPFILLFPSLPPFSPAILTACGLELILKPSVLAAPAPSALSLREAELVCLACFYDKSKDPCPSRIANSRRCRATCSWGGINKLNTLMNWG